MMENVSDVHSKTDEFSALIKDQIVWPNELLPDSFGTEWFPDGEGEQANKGNRPEQHLQ